MIKKIIKYFSYKYKYAQAVIYFGATVSKSVLERGAVLFSRAQVIDCEVGAYSYIQSRSVVVNTRIGPYCSIASDVTIGLATHPIDFISTNPVFYDNTQPLPESFIATPKYENHIAPTVIGADVWIGQRVLIKAGLNIGVGAIIGAGAIVTKDVEPYSVVAGVPATFLKWRFTPKLCSLLHESKWWNTDTTVLRKLSKYFDDPEVFVAKLQEVKLKDV
ncbi:CatB-related O-acetyltransferase [Neptuniibacter pectenicola]|uniref:CatB-related O-acetyltransferase n=1 Tax=Neptuniibacter pectenicola TaxID=1806669 RepID=UPI000835373B|nr:CatB-related O-acetyltransferase [Neptuniibacter pectenicola]